MCICSGEGDYNIGLLVKPIGLLSKTLCDGSYVVGCLYDYWFIGFVLGCSARCTFRLYQLFLVSLAWVLGD